MNVSTNREAGYTSAVPISRTPNHRLSPVPRLPDLERFVGLWVAIKGEEVIAASDSSGSLAYELRRMGSRADGAVTEYVRPGRDDAYIVGVG